MSEDEKGFLSRWSQRKREAGKADEKPPAADDASQQAKPPAETIAVAEAESPIDLESLPKLEDLTANTDLTVFFKKGVPESLRNAALRKSWALDPAIRNYVNPALDYAYDWNTPGGVPGSGELAPGTDIARLVAQVMGSGQRAEAGEKPEAVDKPGETLRRGEPHFDAAEHQAEPISSAPSVRLSDASSADEPRVNAAAEAPAALPSDVPVQAEPQPRDVALQQESRRHGTARPK
jgi:hypothetical protein